MTPDQFPARIFTFYSYKGGVGRSMALANIAEILVRRGLRVRMVDFDLEAPGLERYFDIPDATSSLQQILAHRGVIDMLDSHRHLTDLKRVSSEPTREAQHDSNAGPLTVEPLSNFEVVIYPGGLHAKSGITGRLSLVPAGSRDAAAFRDYAKRVLRFDWDGFFTKYNGEQFFEWFRGEICKDVDIVLIDSRTGVTEMSGVCTYHLADVVVSFLAANFQNMDGLVQLASNLSNPEFVNEARRGRALLQIFVPSRVANDDEAKVEEFKRRFDSRLGPFFPPVLRFGPETFIALKLPYVPIFAYDERVAGREGIRATEADLLQAYERLTRAMALLAPVGSLLHQSYESASAAPPAREPPRMPPASETISQGPPARPKSEAELGFERQTFVRWFSPAELLRAGIYALLGGLFGSFADKREMQAALNSPQRGRLQQYADEALQKDFWFDYVADIGDGFNATYSIALLLAREWLPLQVDRRELLTRRGSILLMGGDEVYPSASRKNYHDRSIGPYRTALPYIANEDQAPHLYALPGNHDWYDGLSAFLRQFAQHDQRWIGAWRTQQRRSYFARKLPLEYWLWGVDIQLHADIDSPQLGYFQWAAAQLRAGDRVILATAEPSWVKEAEGEHAGYQSLLLLMREVTERGARVVLVVTGDSHHYARYRDTEGATHFITAGGGGAFLHGTHTLPLRLLLPASTDPARRQLRRELVRMVTFPSVAESRQLIRSRIVLFPWTNRAFALTWFFPWLWLGLLLWSDAERSSEGIVQQLARTLDARALTSLVPLLVALATTFSVALALRLALARRPSDNQVERVESASQVAWRKWVDFGLWSLIGNALLALATAGTPSAIHVLGHSLSRNLSAAALVGAIPLLSAAYVSRPHALEAALVGRALIGVLHGTLYVICWLLVACGVAGLQVALGLGPWLWLLLTPAIAALVSTLLFAGCLWFTGQYQRALLNDAFSAIAVEDYKNFLRFRIDPSGALTVFAIGLKRVARRWRLDPAGGPGAPYVVPADIELTPHLIERVVIAPGQGGADRSTGSS